MAAELKPLMPKATAVWLVDNTALSFEQIADFCGLHPLEVKGIADEDVAKGIKGQDPVTLGLCSQLELDLAVSRVNAKLERAQKRAARKGASLKSIAETTAPPVTPAAAEGEGAPAPDDWKMSSELEQD